MPTPRGPLAIDGALLFEDLAEVGRRVDALVEIGYDGIYAFEGAHDGFLPFVTAAERTTTQVLSTQIAVAFARSPLTLAYQANDLQMASRGRFVVGLGTQARPNIEKRYGMPWGKPVTRMREIVQGIREIQTSWQQQRPPHFVGEYYRHTKMQPMFAPAPNPYGPPPIMLGGIGAPMTRAAGELADWFVVIPFSTPRFVEELTVRALREGLVAAGRTWSDLKLAVQCMVVTGQDERAMAEAVARTKMQIGFYGSTPTYKKALDAEGWGELHEPLRKMARAGQWQKMCDLVSDDMLARFAVVGTPEEVGAKLVNRVGAWANRVSLMTTYELAPMVAARIVEDVHARTAGRGTDDAR